MIACTVIACMAPQVSTSHDGYNSYRINRRFRQFDTLHSALARAYKGLPELPSKRPASGEGFLERRSAALTVYLGALLADPVLAVCDEVRSFLELSSAEQLFKKLQEKDVYGARHCSATPPTAP